MRLTALTVGRRPSTTGFTLIELLIVIAIILILIAIALPNFLEAQIRAKVARVKSEFRSLETALVAYRTDNPRYPFGERAEAPYLRRPEYVDFPTISVVHELTTPVRYMQSVNFRDPFLASCIVDGNGNEICDYFYLNYETFWYSRNVYTALEETAFEGWSLISFGPSLTSDGGAWPPLDYNYSGGWFWHQAFYSATNGTTSKGDLVRYSDLVPPPVKAAAGS